MSRERVIVVDGTGHIMGRLASVIAKRLLEGEKVVVVNAENIVISGNPYSIIDEWKRFLEVGEYRKGPFHPRRPDTIFRRVVRGMLPRRKFKGRRAFKRLKVYIGVPDSFKDVEFTVIEEAQASRLKGPRMSLGELAKHIGWKGGGK